MYPAILNVAEAAAPAYSDFSSIIGTITTAIPVSTVVAVISGVLGATIGFVFMWWGARYGVRKLLAAVRRGKGSV